MSSSGITMKKASEKDVPMILQLMLRLKKLNEEFDPLFKVREDADAAGEKYLRDAMKSGASLVVVAEKEGRIVGMAKADIRQRTFYEPRMEGRIVDLYLLPEYRRKALGQKIIDFVVESLKKEVGIVTVEFPSANKIAERFYTKLGFRPVLSNYVKGD